MNASTPSSRWQASLDSVHLMLTRWLTSGQVVALCLRPLSLSVMAASIRDAASYQQSRCKLQPNAHVQHDLIPA